MNLDRFRVQRDDDEILKQVDPGDTGRFKDKDDAIGHLDAGLERLDDLQERVYASDRYSVLLVFQGMDAAGKDSAIKHVLSGVNPQGTEVHAFKQPSSEELSHDFLWRAAKVLPARGRIGIFNRSYYEDVLIVRVHPDLVAERRLPDDRITGDLWTERFEDIVAFERHLFRNGTIIRKFFLHVSREEQSRRLLERLEDPAKHWKFALGDIAERENWKRYRTAYAEALAATSRAHAPWYVVPADHKWFAHLVIAEVVVQALEALDLSLPDIDAKHKRQIARARRALKHR